MAEAKWYVAHTYSGYENKVAKSLEAIVENRRLHDLIQDIKVPTETLVEIKDGKRKEKENILFPSYVFVKMILTDDTWFIVRNTRGVTGFVGSEPTKPVPLTEAEMKPLGIRVHFNTLNPCCQQALHFVRQAVHSCVNGAKGNKAVIFLCPIQDKVIDMLHSVFADRYRQNHKPINSCILAPV